MAAAGPDGERRGCPLSRAILPPWTLAVSTLAGFLLGAATSLTVLRAGPAAREPAGDDSLSAAAAEHLPMATTTTALPSSPRRTGPLKVAVCISGHVRSFVAPGLVQRWEKYMLRRDREVVTDVYMVAKLGNDNHGDQKYYPRNATDPRLECPLAILKPYLKHFELVPKGGDCSSVVKIWERLGMCSMPCFCCYGPYFHQVAGMHAVIHMARGSGIDYDFYVRLRPDVQLRSPIQYQRLNSSKLIFQIRQVGSGHDHMFIVGRGAVDTTFREIFEMYYHRPPCNGGAPDNDAFPLPRIKSQCQIIQEHGGPWEMPIIHRGREMRCAKRASISALGVNDTSNATYCHNLLRACGPGSDEK